MKKALMIVGAVLVSLVIIGITITVSGTAPRKKGSFSVTDIKGDSLGMGLEEYMKKHPDSHCDAEEPACVEVAGTTYAGVAFNKSASFTNARLYDLTYFGAPEFYHDQVLQALQEKYGEPRCITSGNDHACDWWNGSATIRLLYTPNGTSVRFTLDELAHAAAQKTEAKQAQDRKTDQ